MIRSGCYTALSGKRAHIITRPDVKRALLLWFCHMEEKGETVSGPMLVAKWEGFVGFTTGYPKPAVFPKRVTRVRVQ
jgi:hypothetical protein